MMRASASSYPMPRSAPSASSRASATLSLIRSGVMLLLDPQICVAHHFGPLFNLELDAGGERVGRVGDRLEAHGREPFADVGLGNAFGDLARQQFDDLFRRAGRCNDAGHRIGLL